MDVLVAAIYLLIAYIGCRIISKVLSIPQLSNLGSRHILITGCDHGFGNAAAKRLDGMGCHVIAACLTEKGETDLQKSCSNQLRTIHMDVSNTDSVQKAYKKVCDFLPPSKGLWGLVNNAGIAGGLVPIEWTTLEDYHKALSVNLIGLVDVTLTFLPLIKKEKGRIVNMASIAGRVSIVKGPYTVSKYAVEAFSDQLRRGLKCFKVTTHIIEPEYFKTDMTNLERVEKDISSGYERLTETMQAEYGREYFEAVIKQTHKTIHELAQPDITPVLDAYTHALLGKFPKARYLPGKRQTMWLTIQALPEWIGDRILELFERNIPLPAACKK